MDVFDAEQRLLKVARNLKPVEIEEVRNLTVLDGLRGLADRIDDLQEAHLEEVEE
jgi:hypothetical protein